MRYDGALDEYGGGGYGEKVISHLRTAWGVKGTRETKKSMVTPRFQAWAKAVH